MPSELGKGLHARKLGILDERWEPAGKLLVAEQVLPTGLEVAGKVNTEFTAVRVDVVVSVALAQGDRPSVLKFPMKWEPRCSGCPVNIALYD